MGSGEITGVVDPGLQSLVSVSRDDEIPDCRVGEEAGDLSPVSMVPEDWLEAVTEDRDPGPLTQHDPSLTVRHNVPPRTGQTDLLHWPAAPEVPESQREITGTVTRQEGGGPALKEAGLRQSPASPALVDVVVELRGGLSPV